MPSMKALLDKFENNFEEKLHMSMSGYFNMKNYCCSTYASFIGTGIACSKVLASMRLILQRPLI